MLTRKEAKNMSDDDLIILGNNINREILNRVQKNPQLNNRIVELVFPDKEQRPLPIGTVYYPTGERYASSSRGDQVWTITDYIGNDQYMITNKSLKERSISIEAFNRMKKKADDDAETRYKGILDATNRTADKALMAKCAEKACEENKMLPVGTVLDASAFNQSIPETKWVVTSNEGGMYMLMNMCFEKRLLKREEFEALYNANKV